MNKLLIFTILGFFQACSFIDAKHDMIVALKGRPLEEKIGRLTETDVKGLIEAHGVNPRNIELDPSEKAVEDLQLALKVLPSSLKSFLSSKVVHILFAKNLGDSSFSVYLKNKNDEVKSGIIFLDRQKLHKSFEKWFLDEELGARHFSAGKVKLKIKTKGSFHLRDHQYAYLFAFLHEAGHLANLDTALMPGYGTVLEKVKPNDFPFFRLSWEIVGYSILWRYSVINEDLNFYRKNGTYYHSLRKVFEQFQKTNHPLLQTLSDPFEDWALSFAYFIFSKELKTSFEYILTFDKGTKRAFKSCQDLNCQKKLQYISDFLKRKGVELPSS